MDLQVMAIVAITGAALIPTVFAPATGKRVMPPEVGGVYRQHAVQTYKHAVTSSVPRPSVGPLTVLMFNRQDTGA